MSSLISTADLQLAIDAGDVFLIDVRLSDDYAAGHLPSAANHCVFEVGFVAAVEKLAADKQVKVVVYGANPSSYEARMAAAKLVRSGYEDVAEYRVGYAGWMAAGKPIKIDHPASDDENVQELVDGRHDIDLAESAVVWTGRNLMNSHRGEIRLLSGFIHVTDGVIVGGEAVVDMTSMICSDLKGDAMHDVLIDHLASDDFFDVESHPTASFVISQVEPSGSVADGRPNLELFGDLMVKGVDVPIQIAAVTGVTSDGRGAAQASFSLDRTLWGVIYGSGSFFANVGMHLVNDLIDLELKVVTRLHSS